MVFGVRVISFGIAFVVRKHRDCPRRMQARREELYRGSVLARRILVADKSLLEGVGTFDATFNAFAERRQLRLIEFVVNFLGNARHARKAMRN